MLVADYLRRLKKRAHRTIGRLRGRVPKTERDRAVRRYLRSKGARIYKRINGITLVQYPDHIGGRLLQGRLWGFDEFESALAFLRPHLKSGAFIEFGASSGMHSVYAAQQNLFTKIVAIEPLEANFELLCVNLRLNNVDNAVTIQCAVSDREGDAKMPVNPNIGASSFADNFDQFENVRTRRLDNLIEEIGVDPSSVALIWICVRGHEKQVLDGMPQLLDAKVPLIVYFCPHSEPSPTIRLLQSHYQHCAWEGANEPAPIASLRHEHFKGNIWLAVW